ncbi:hypothetical protein GCM10027341_28520 [Spirosoma knui]
MKTRKAKLIVTALVLLVFSCEKRICGCVFPPSPIAGTWQLTRITYGLTQKTVTAAEAGYSETLTFDGTYESGQYRRIRSGIPVETSAFSLRYPNGGTDGMLLFQADTSQQSFRVADKRLYLSERSPQNATLADGSTYEYQRE